MGKKDKKSLAMKLLDGKKCSYELVVYPDSLRDAVQIAAYLGVSDRQLFKSLIVQYPPPLRRGNKPLVAVIAARDQLSLKKLAKAVGTKKLQMATHAEAEQLTGLQVGGISPLLLINKGFQIWLDEAVKSQTAVYISAGERGKNLLVQTADLQRLTGARITPMVET